MPSSLSLKEQLACRAIAQRMFSEKKDPKGEVVESGLVGQLVYWNEDKNFGFIRTHEEERYLCHGSAFLSQCSVNDVVTFDAWEKFRAVEPEKARKAINVKAHQRATTEIVSDKIGKVARWFGVSAWKAIIEDEDGKTYPCSMADFDKDWLPRDARVCFDIIQDNWTGDCRAVNIRSAKIDRHVQFSGVEGRIVRLSHSYGFVSTKICDEDLYFSCREVTRLRMESIKCHSRISCDVVMQEDGSLTAENILLLTPAIDIIKKPPVDDDCASTSTKAVTDEADDATSKPVTPEMRKLLKKLREIGSLEGRPDLDRLEQAKVAMKDEFQRRLMRLQS